MISVNQAFELYRREIAPLARQELGLHDALWRVLAQDIHTTWIDLPSFTQSAMDGYALRAEDTRRASSDRPVSLRLKGRIAAGQTDQLTPIGHGEAVGILTGGRLPEGANAVVRQENTQVSNGFVLVAAQLEPGRDARPCGEEIAAGALLAPAGTRITPGHLTACAASGIGRLPVRRMPRISLLTNGDERIDPGCEQVPGQVYDINTTLVLSWLQARGYAEITSRRVGDNLPHTEKALADELDRCDLLLTTGGVSKGSRDFVTEAARRVGIRPVFGGVEQQPAKPLFFGMLGQRVMIGLPGNPGAVFTCLVIHIRRVLDLLEGANSLEPVFFAARLQSPVEASPKCERWIRCHLAIAADAELWLSALPHQHSHMITELPWCDALARIPKGERRLEAGAIVSAAFCSYPGPTSCLPGAHLQQSLFEIQAAQFASTPLFPSGNHQ